MAAITVPGMFLTGDHASRPAASSVGGGSLYACSDHNLIYQSDTSSWTTWATLGSPVADILDLPTAEMDDSLVLAPDGAGGVEFRAEAGGSGGGLLGVTSYAPGSDTTIGSSSSGTLVDVDATNLQVAFTAPASGNVLVRLDALGGPTTGGPNTYWGVRESTSIIAGPSLMWPSGGAAGLHMTGAFLITGISGGSHTYKFAFAASGGTTAVYGGPTFGKVVIEVWAAP